MLWYTLPILVSNSGDYQFEYKEGLLIPNKMINSFFGTKRKRDMRNKYKTVITKPRTKENIS
jgi:hypothetical protein